MSDLTVERDRGAVAIRVFGTMALLFVSLIAVLLAVRPEMMMNAVRAVMGMMS